MQINNSKVEGINTFFPEFKDLKILENEVGVLFAAGAGLRSELSRWNKVLSLDASSSDKIGVPSADLLTPEEERRKQLNSSKSFTEEGEIWLLKSSHNTAKPTYNVALTFCD